MASWRILSVSRLAVFLIFTNNSRISSACNDTSSQNYNLLSTFIDLFFADGSFVPGSGTGSDSDSGLGLPRCVSPLPSNLLHAVRYASIMEIPTEVVAEQITRMDAVSLARRRGRRRTWLRTDACGSRETSAERRTCHGNFDTGDDLLFRWGKSLPFHVPYT